MSAGLAAIFQWRCKRTAVDMRRADGGVATPPAAAINCRAVPWTPASVTGAGGDSTSTFSDDDGSASLSVSHSKSFG